MAKDNQDKLTIDAFPRRRGRPRKYANDAERVRAWRERQKAMQEKGTRIRKELSLQRQYVFALEAIARKRGISQSALLEQIMEQSGVMDEWAKP